MKIGFGITLIVLGIMFMICGAWFLGIPCQAIGIVLLVKREKKSEEKQEQERRD